MSHQARDVVRYGIDKPHIWRDQRGWWMFKMGVRRGPMVWSEIRELAAR